MGRFGEDVGKRGDSGSLEDGTDDRGWSLEMAAGWQEESSLLNTLIAG